jgi:spore germination cell wall hydrolase CwlJ-like protein
MRFMSKVYKGENQYGYPFSCAQRIIMARRAMPVREPQKARVCNLLCNSKFSSA